MKKKVDLRDKRSKRKIVRENRRLVGENLIQAITIQTLQLQVQMIYLHGSKAGGIVPGNGELVSVNEVGKEVVVPCTIEIDGAEIYSQVSGGFK